jgi:hypothetical protein
MLHLRGAYPDQAILRLALERMPRLVCGLLSWMPQIEPSEPQLACSAIRA